MRENSRTSAWALYEKGRQYNNSLVPNQYRLVNTNLDFFAGNQWRNIPQTAAMARLPKPVFNIIKRVTSLFVASLTSAGYEIQFSPLSDYGGGARKMEHDAAEFATAEVENLLEKFKMEYRIREALYDGAQTGDYCAHFWWDPDAAPYGGLEGYRGEIQMELVDGINVMFGNPNDARVEQQPYILLLGRAPVEQLREEMRRWKAKGEVYADHEVEEQAGIGGKTELEPCGEEDGKALYVYLYTKVPVWEPVVDAATGEVLQEPVFDKNGDVVFETDEKGRMLLDALGEPVVKTKDVMRRVERVHVTKATRDAVIFEDVDTGLSRYPIAWGNWERQKNQYHGRALVTGLVPNQIFINTMFAMAMRHEAADRRHGGDGHGQEHGARHSGAARRERREVVLRHGGDSVGPRDRGLRHGDHARELDRAVGGQRGDQSVERRHGHPRDRGRQGQQADRDGRCGAECGLREDEMWGGHCPPDNPSVSLRLTNACGHSGARL